MLRVPMRTVLASLLASLLLALALAAPAHALIPDDPGTSGQPGGWQSDQWNFLAGTGVDAPRAWDNLIARGKPGGLGVKVAVLDTGLAYEDRGRFRRSPEVSRSRLARGYDFCAHPGSFGDPCAGKDAHPDDENGHGTHVAATLAAATVDGIGETGLADAPTLLAVGLLGRFRGGEPGSTSAGPRHPARPGRR